MFSEQKKVYRGGNSRASRCVKAVTYDTDVIDPVGVGAAHARW